MRDFTWPENGTIGRGDFAYSETRSMRDFDNSGSLILEIITGARFRLFRNVVDTWFREFWKSCAARDFAWPENVTIGR